jgi:hypothetical protein
MSCHEGGPPTKYTWFGVNIVTRAVGHEGRKAGQDCVPCHKLSYNQFVTMAQLRPVIRSAVITSNPRLLPNGGLRSGGPAAGTGRFDHQGVLPTQCLTCHNGVAARGLSAKHLPTKVSCDTCHRTTTWLPAQFSHVGVVAGQCVSCHNGAKATGKTGTHFLTVRSCDVCHRKEAWKPVTYTHLSPAYQAGTSAPTCVTCHVTNGEMVPRMMHGNPRIRPVPAPPGP